MKSLLISVAMLSSGCATLKAAQPQLVLCVEGIVSIDNLKKVVASLESGGWAGALTATAIDLGDAGLCAIQAIANANIPTAVAGLGSGPTSATARVSPESLGITAEHKLKAQCWLEAHGIQAKATQ